MKRNITLSVLALLFTICAHKAEAASPDYISSILKVSPVILKIQLEPGAKHLYPITIENLTNAPMPIRANVEGFDPSDEETGYTPNPQPEASPLASWISISDPDAIIPAFQSREFFVKISIPPTVPIGGYFAMIYFTPLYSHESVGSKIGVITLANIGVQDSLDQKASISQFRFEQTLYEQNPITAHVKVRNDSLHYFSTKPTLTISPLWGISDSVQLDEKTILPGKTRSWKSVFTIKNSKWGIYKATISTRLENGVSLKKSIPLIVLPIKYISAVVLLIGLVILLFLKRRNILGSLRILFSDDQTRSYTKTPPIETPTAQDDAQSQPATGAANTLTTSRIKPSRIIETLRQNNGSINETSKILGVHRSTIHRWQQRAKTLGKNEITQLGRKSTRPHTVRKTSLSSKNISQILGLYKNMHLSAGDIRKKLRLTVSTRTILRALKNHS